MNLFWRRQLRRHHAAAAVRDGDGRSLHDRWRSLLRLHRRQHRRQPRQRRHAEVNVPGEGQRHQGLYGCESPSKQEFGTVISVVCLRIAQAQINLKNS